MLNQVIRYEPVVRLVQEAGGQSLLEAGSGSKGIAARLGGDWEVTACDVDFSDYGAVDHAAGPTRRVEADVRDLPFEDASFDVVVALDLIEHVPPADRGRALAELARVAARRLVVGCPAGTAALEADRRLAIHYRRIGRPAPTWLDEHLDHGFPEWDDLRAPLEGMGRVTLHPSESVSTHERLVRLEARPLLTTASSMVSRALDLVVRSRARPLRRLGRATSALLRGFDRQPAYRCIAVLDPDRLR